MRENKAAAALHSCKAASAVIQAVSVFAEVEFLFLFFAEGIAEKLLLAFRAEIVAKLLVGGGCFVGIGNVVVHLLQELTHRLHVVLVEVCFGDFSGILGRVHFDFYHVAMLIFRHEFFAAKITGKVQHERVALPKPMSNVVGQRLTGYSKIGSDQPTRSLRQSKVLHIHPSQV